MKIPFTDRGLTKSTGCLLAIVAFFLIGILGVVGQSFYGDIDSTTVTLITVVILGVLLAFGYSANKQYANESEEYKESEESVWD